MLVRTSHPPPFPSLSRRGFLYPLSDKGSDIPGAPLRLVVGAAAAIYGPPAITGLDACLIRGNFEIADALKQAQMSVALKPRADVIGAVAILRFQTDAVRLIFLPRLTLLRTARTRTFAAVFPEWRLGEVVGH